MWAVMRAVPWSDVETTMAPGVKLTASDEGPQHFIPIFDTREQAVAWNGSEDFVV